MVLGRARLQEPALSEAEGCRYRSIRMRALAPEVNGSCSATRRWSPLLNSPPTTNQVSNWRLARRSCMLADLPPIFACGQSFDDLSQFLWPICPKAGHHSIEQQDQRNDRNQIRPEQP